MDWSRDTGRNGSVYAAQSGGWTYTVDQLRPGQWVLRGKGPAGQPKLYVGGFSTASTARENGDKHNAHVTK